MRRLCFGGETLAAAELLGVSVDKQKQKTSFQKYITLIEKAVCVVFFFLMPVLFECNFCSYKSLSFS